MGISRGAVIVVLVAATSSVALPTAAVALAHQGTSATVPGAAVTMSPSATGATARPASPAATDPERPDSTREPADRAPTDRAPADRRTPLTPGELAALPEARYDAVIAGLVGVASPRVPELSRVAYSLRADTPISEQPGGTPIARFAAKNFLGEPTVVVRVALQGKWALVLTPARSALPSQNGGSAPAQTAGWVPASALTSPVSLPDSIVISVSRQTLTIDSAGAAPRSFPVGVGTPSTPTPQGVTGYLQARYLDPAQNQARYPVQLSSLHSSAADEPFGGSDGGLIGVHYERTANGAVSHGCVRLSAEAVNAVNSLPLGTPITITE